MASSSSSAPVPHHCGVCGSLTGKSSRCSACQEAWYCSKEHQRADWKSHKYICRHVVQHRRVVCIKVEEGEGSGLGNKMTNYVFDNKEQGLGFVSSELGGNMSRPLHSPFAELLGWKLHVHCSTRENEIYPSSRDIQVSGKGSATLNSAGIYLGCDLLSGLTHFNNLRGEIFVFGRRIEDGTPLISDSLWGILNFIWDAMDFYPEFPRDRLSRWAQRYQLQSWVPLGGDGGIDVYCVDINRSKDKMESPTASTTSPPSQQHDSTQARPQTQQQGQAPSGFSDAFFQKCAVDFVGALRADQYPDESSENIWGIEMSSGPRTGFVQDMPLGVVIYNVYQEIFKRRLFHGRESMYGSPGPASKQFTSDLAAALKFWTLPRDFEEWTNQVVYDEAFSLGVYSTEMKRRGFFTEQNLVNPNLEGHRNFMKYFTGELRPGEE